MAADMDVQVGDSSKNLLANYQRCARELLKSALSQQSCGTTYELNRPLKQANLSRTLKKEKLLEEQREAAIQLELRKQLSEEPLGSVSVSEDEGYVDSVRQRVKSLEDELLVVKCEHNKNCQLLQCLHRGREMRERLATEDEVGVADKHLLKWAGLTKELLREVGEVGRMRREVVKLRRERVKIQQESRLLMKSLQARGLEQQQADAGCSDGHMDEDTGVSGESSGGEVGRLDKAEKEVCLLRHTLQALISASGVNWSQDKELLQLTLELGDDKRWT